jgi:alpha-glucosidase
MRPDGSHPLWDRDDVHEIYADWRRIFDSYDPPRFAVGEASCTQRGALGMHRLRVWGQAFNFAMQDADWRPEDYREVINSGVADMINFASTTSWLLGCHDTPRVATRYGLPLAEDRPAQQVAREWLLADGATPQLDRALGERRARAAIMILLALPGSAYIYQGDELGFRKLPIFRVRFSRTRWPVVRPRRKAGTDVECRCHGARTAPRTGSANASDTCPSRNGSRRTPSVFRRPIPAQRSTSTVGHIALRSELFAGDDLRWVESGSSVLHFARPGGVGCITNFGAAPVDLPSGEILLSSGQLDQGRLPSDTTVWLRAR